MDELNGEYLSRHKNFRLKSRKLAALFFCVSLIVAAIVFWQLKLVGITVTGEAFCGLQEHSHSEECYLSELVCGFSEETTSFYETTSSQTSLNEETSFGFSETTEKTSTHVHVEECYKKTLVCELSEHIHTQDCYPDFSADVEKESDWLKYFENINFSENTCENLLAVAKTQLGYCESELNFEIDENRNKKGYTRYGEWYGEPYADWNSIFVSFCLEYGKIQITEDLISSDAESFFLNWEEKGLVEASLKHSAKAGEILFLDMNSDGKVDCLSVISEVSEGKIKVILGDFNNRVEEISVENEETIFAYGLTRLLAVKEEFSEETTTEETTQEETTAEENTETKAEETTVEPSQTVHQHSQLCYTEDNLLICTLWEKLDPWELDRSSEEFEETAINYVSYLINRLPKTDDFENKLSELETEENEEAYEAYYGEVYALASKAWVNFENLGPKLREKVPNKNRLLDYEWLYSSRSTLAVTQSRSVEFVNYYDKATENKTVLIHGNSVGTYSNFGFWYWYAVVVDENEYGDLIVTAKYDTNLKDKSNLKPTTDRGFVLLSHGDNNTFSCEIGNEATVNFDYLNTSAGRNLSGYGVVTFSTYTEPVDTEEDVTITPDEPSDYQVSDAGGIMKSKDGSVVVTKTIDGTELENVFDITLSVQTETSVQTFLSEPDMAVVVVMDISNTMNNAYPKGQTKTSRYDAAVEAAENFINQFAANTAGLSRLGFVAFNTSGHEILELQPCTTGNSDSLIQEMKDETADIIDNYVSGDRTRFTNVEAGLKMGYDMLSSSDNANKYIVFLSDGFPTTYLKSGTTTYEGYDPYTSSGTKGADGVFYDFVKKYYCSAGTSYSDKASIRAREMATAIKNEGAKIFSIGIDVGGQTIAGYERTDSLSVIDRTSTTYEIGDASSTAAYQNWLKNSIGSGYYYDSTNKNDINNAFENIFEEMRRLNDESIRTIWTATDPLPVLDEDAKAVEFIQFFNKDGALAGEALSGKFAEGGENTANHENHIIYWDLKKSGYTTTTEDNKTLYYYEVKYRVRLQNENGAVKEETIYNTNGNAFLEYRTIVTTNGVQEFSEEKTVYFPKPSVFGYLSEFGFVKTDDLGNGLEGAEFSLIHNTSECSACKGDGTSVSGVETHIAVSAKDGAVNFSNVPSGHSYILNETKIPDGFLPSENTYSVVVSYDKLTVTEHHPDGTSVEWTGSNNAIVNPPELYILPETGGMGVLPLAIIGISLMLYPILYIILRRKKERGFS